MKNLIFILSILLFVSCKKREPNNFYKDRETSVLELRQLINSKETTEQTSGSFFLVFGSMESSSEINYSIKVFAKVDGYYRVIDIPIDKLRVNIDNNLEKPNLKITYHDRKMTDSEIAGNRWVSQTYIINCPEKYLPEKLLPIDL